MPDEPIAEAFRDFPCQPRGEWPPNKLCPDLAVHGVLKATGAALFVEYDGYYRHMEPSGLARDMRKTRALLRSVPKGSVVVRIAHEQREWKDKSVQLLADCWHAEHSSSLLKTVQQVATSLLDRCRGQLLPRVVSRLEAFAAKSLDKGASFFAKHAELVGASNSSRLKKQGFLQNELLLKEPQVAKVVARHPQVLGLSIEDNLQPTVDWIKGLGLNQMQVAKVIVSHPSVLGYSIEDNLQPTVGWIKGLGLNQMQVAKVIVSHPSVLGYSIEDNLQPTVDWIKGLGLNQMQVAKVVVRFPCVLGLSVEANLQPTVDWIKGLGLNQMQVAKVIVRFPHLLSYSIEDNLQPTVDWIKGLGLNQMQVAKVIVSHPSVLSYNISTNLMVKRSLLLQYFPAAEAAKLLTKVPRLWSYSYNRLQHRLDVLECAGELSKLAGAMTQPLDAFNRRFLKCQQSCMKLAK